jgi:hypothetical protein
VPTIVSYNASAVKIYNAASSLVHYERKNIFCYLKKRSSLCTIYNAGVGVVNFEVVGLAPDIDLHFTKGDSRRQVLFPTTHLGCQMVYFKNKNPNLGIYCGHLHSIRFLFWYVWTKKTLSTLVDTEHSF